MSELATTPTRGLSNLRSCALLLAVALLLATGVMAAVNFGWYGLPGLVAAVIAGGVVAIGMFAALGITRLGAGKNGVQFALGAQLVRLLVPLAGGMWLQEAFPALGKAGVFLCVLAIYLPMLLVETVLAVRMISGAPKGVRHG